MPSFIILKPTTVPNLNCLNDEKVVNFIIDKLPNVIECCLKFTSNNVLVFDVDLLICYLKTKNLYINKDDTNIYIYNYKDKEDKLIYAKIVEPCLVAVGNNWISGHKHLIAIDYDCPQLITVYDDWMSNCMSLETVNFKCPKLRNVGFSWMYNCKKLKIIYFNNERVDNMYNLRKRFDLVQFV